MGGRSRVRSAAGVPGLAGRGEPSRGEPAEGQRAVRRLSFGVGARARAGAVAALGLDDVDRRIELGGAGLAPGRSAGAGWRRGASARAAVADGGTRAAQLAGEL